MPVKGRHYGETLCDEDMKGMVCYVIHEERSTKRGREAKNGPIIGAMRVVVLMRVEMCSHGTHCTMYDC